MARRRTSRSTWRCRRRLLFFADTGAIASSGIVTVREYGSSSAPSARLVSTKTSSLLVAGMASRCRSIPARSRRRESSPYESTAPHPLLALAWSRRKPAASWSPASTLGAAPQVPSARSATRRVVAPASRSLPVSSELRAPQPASTTVNISPRSTVRPIKARVSQNEPRLLRGALGPHTVSQARARDTLGATYVPQASTIGTLRVSCVPQARASDTLRVSCVPQARASDTLRVSCVSQARASDTLRVSCVPQAGASDTLQVACVPQARGRVLQISTWMSLALTCVSQVVPTASFGVTSEVATFASRASRSSECAPRPFDCAAPLASRACRPSFCASAPDLRAASRFDCASPSDFCAFRHSWRPRRSLRPARSLQVACLSPLLACRSALRATRRSKLAPLKSVLAASKPLAATPNERLATPNERLATPYERLATPYERLAIPYMRPRGLEQKLKRSECRGGFGSLIQSQFLLIFPILL